MGLAQERSILQGRAMRPLLRALASRQGGLFTRKQAIEAGCTERELRTMTAVHGPWVIVRRGVYCERELVESMTSYGDQMRLVDRAVHLTAETDHVMSHDSAARSLRIPMLDPARELSHLTREGVGGTRTERGVKHHLTRIDLPVMELSDGVPVTTPARTAVDLAREHGLFTGVAACDHVLASGVPRAALQNELNVMWCWPHITRARAAVDLADAGAESIGESLLRLVVTELGIGRPETQFPILLAAGVAWADLRVGCHVFEFDGRLKYRRRDQGGVADRPAEEVVWDERNREREILGEGLGVSRVIWNELFGAARVRLRLRLQAEYTETLQRFGDTLPPHLAEFAARMRGRRRRSA
jgi:hypothetical protein